MLGTYSHTLLQQIMTSTWPSETIMIQLDVNLQGLLLQCYNGRKLLDSQEIEFTKEQSSLMLQRLRYANFNSLE